MFFVKISVFQVESAKTNDRMDLAELVVLEHGTTSGLVAHLIRAVATQLHSGHDAPGHRLQDLHRLVLHLVLRDPLCPHDLLPH